MTSGFGAAGWVHGQTSTISSFDFVRVSYSIATTPTTTAWNAANIALYIPFNLERAVTVSEVWVQTGTLTTSNNIEIGCYRQSDLSRVFRTAMTITTASDLVNSSSMTDVDLPPGDYYMAMSCDGTRAFLMTSLALGIQQSIGIVEQTGLTGATLPDPMVPVTLTRATLPLFGFNLRADAL